MFLDCFTVVGVLGCHCPTLSISPSPPQSGLMLGSYLLFGALWPIQSPSKGTKRKAKGYEEREIRSSLLILDLKDGKLLD